MKEKNTVQFGLMKYIKLLKIIDQTKLPHQFIIKDLKTVKDAINAIKTMEVRGRSIDRGNCCLWISFINI